MGKQYDLLLAIFWIFFNLILTDAKGQDYLKDPQLIEVQVNDLHGIQKLEALNILSSYYRKSDSKKGFKYSKQADDLADKLFNDTNALLLDSTATKEGIKAYANHGSLLFKDSKLASAKDRFEKCLRLSENSKDTDAEQFALDMIIKIDSIGVKESFLKRTIRPLALGDKISNSSSGLKIKSLLKLAVIHEKKENYSKAIKNYTKVVDLMRDRGDAKGVTEIQAKIAEMNRLSGNYKEALAYYEMSEDNFNRLGDSTAAEQAKSGRAAVFEEVREMAPAILKPKNSPSSPQLISGDFDNDSIQSELDRYISLAKQYEEEQDLTQSIKYYKLYNELYAKRMDALKQLSKDSMALVNQAQEIRLLVQDNELIELEVERRNTALAQAANFRKWLIIGLVLALVLFFVFYWLFVTKKRAHSELSVTYKNLEEARGRLQKAETKIKKLLGQQVSTDIAQALLDQKSGEVTSRFVCIMFLDIRDFTPFAESRRPEEIIAYQNDVFGFMIEIIAKYKGVIYQFMGDGFMATFGVPTSYDNDVQNAFDAAKAIVQEVNERSQSGSIHKTRVGIGLHAGNVVAGNVGTEIRKQYSVTGNTVITAARIEQLNKTYNSQLLISDTVYQHVNVEPEIPGTPIVTWIKGRKQPIGLYKVI